MLEMRCFSRTAPIEKPAMKSSTVGSKNCTTSARRGSSASLDAARGGRKIRVHFVGEFVGEGAC